MTQSTQVIYYITKVLYKFYWTTTPKIWAGCAKVGALSNPSNEVLECSDNKVEFLQSIQGRVL